MTPTPASYEELEGTIRTWAQKRTDIRSVIVVGSRARTDRPADAWSDLDLILFTMDVQACASDSMWLEEIGEVWVSLRNTTGRGDPEWLVLFAGGLKADFVLVTTTGTLQQMIDQSPYHFVFQRGLRVLIDKDNPHVGAELVLPEYRQPCLPTEREFYLAIERFALDAARAAQMLRREELWPANVLCNCELQRHLLTMIEWHAQANQHDTWHSGRFLDAWADPRAVAALRDTFAPWDAVGARRALLAMLHLFHMLAMETAERLGTVYPRHKDRQIRAWLSSMLEEA